MPCAPLGSPLLRAVLLVLVAIAGSAAEPVARFAAVRAQWSFDEVLSARFAQTYDWRFAPLQQGESWPPSLTRTALLEPARSGILALYRDLDGRPLARIDLGPGGADVILPDLPGGSYYATLWSPDRPGLRLFRHHVIGAHTGGDLPEAAMAPVLVTDGATGIDLVWTGAAPAKATVLVEERDGRHLPLSSARAELGGAAGWHLALPTLAAGQARLTSVDVRVDDRSVERVLLARSWPGVFPAVAPAAAPAEPGCTATAPRLAVAETLSSLIPFAEARPAAERLLRDARARGSHGLKLWTYWGNIETQPGCYDFTTLDAYVAWLEGEGMPFYLCLGSTLFGQHPLHLWGEWMQDQDGSWRLWRNLPVTTPAGERYRAATTRFVATVVARYRHLRHLAGYVFLNQGGDSFVFPDQDGRVCDYSPAAQERFRTFLAGRYADVAALNARWGSAFPAFAQVAPPRPDPAQAVDLSPAWRDFTDFRIELLRDATTRLFNPAVRGIDPDRPIYHYTAYAGPVEYLNQDHLRDRSATADGGGEHGAMARLLALQRAWPIAHISESHAVPPANQGGLRDLLVNSLRHGLAGRSFNLVWNSLPSTYVQKMERDDGGIQAAMAEWTRLAAGLAGLQATRPEPTGVGALLSWDDLFYRIRTWRWYALPGAELDAGLRAANAAPAWVSGITPAEAVDALRLIVAGDDARVWSAPVLARLERHVRAGGRLLLIGQAGRHVLDATEPYAWRRTLSAPAGTADGDRPPVAAGLPPPAGLTDGVAWACGQGQVLWLPAGVRDADERAQARTDHERFSAVLAWAGIVLPAASSHPAIEAVVLRDGDRRFLVVAHAIGMERRTRAGKTGAAIPDATATITLNTAASGPLRLRQLVASPVGPDRSATLGTGRSLAVTLPASGLAVFAIETAEGQSGR